MDLSQYLKPIVKWWWLIVIASLISAISSYLVTRQQPPVYITRATLVFGKSVFDPNPNSGDFWLGQQLASFYADLAYREPVRNATMEALHLTWLPNYTVQVVSNSQLIDIVVTDTSPPRAQAVANELANQLIKQSPTGRESQEQDRQEFVNQQLANLEEEIKATQDEIQKKQDELAELLSAREISEAQADIQALETKLTTLQANYGTLLASSEQGATNTLSLIERAPLPVQPVGPQTGMMVLLTTVIGAALAAGGAYLIEYLDDTLKDPDEVVRVVKQPIIGYIAQVREQENDATYVANKPRSIVAEAYRNLRTNLEYAAVDKPLKKILVTSTSVAEGKTSVAINLAVVMAQGGKSVILVDTDLRRPSVYSKLGLTNNKGLSDLFRGLELQEVYTPWNVGDVRIITSGPPPPNPADLLGSKRMDHILESLEKEADVVILDGPPVLVADAGILASKVDGVLLVFRHGFTRREVARNATERLTRLGVRILGVVFNRIPRSGISLYGQYGYGDESYYSNHETVKVESVRGSETNAWTVMSRNVRGWFQKTKDNMKPMALAKAEAPRVGDFLPEVDMPSPDASLPEPEKAEYDYFPVPSETTPGEK